MKRTKVLERLGSFILGKGFYIALALCFAVIGVSGYYLVSVFRSGQAVTPQPVTGPARMEVPVQPEKPVQQPAPERDRTPAVPDRSQTRQEPEPQAQPKKEEPVAAAQPVQPARPVYTWPVKGEVSSDFSLEVLAYDETMGDWRTHSGIDISAALGTRVLAMGSGTVKQVYTDDLMGTAVIIDHGQGLESGYYNLTAKPVVAEGDEVVTGTVIGAVGDTAIAEAGRPAHLHFELTFDGRQIDPMEYLPQH